MTKITEESEVGVSNDQISTELDGSAVVLQLTDGVYYELNSVAARVWQLMEERPRQVHGLVELITGEYEIGAGQCRSDVIALLEDMLEHGLIEVR